MIWAAFALAFVGAAILTALIAYLVFSLLAMGEVLEKVDSIKDQPK